MMQIGSCRSLVSLFKILELIYIYKKKIIASNLILLLIKYDINQFRIVS
jgi:hypothetical protein